MTVAFTFTEVFWPDSKWVDGVYLNENENYVVLDLNGEVYKFSGVDRKAVETLVNQSSVGGYFNKEWKHKYGPSKHLGAFDNIYFHKVALSNTRPVGAVQNEWLTPEPVKPKKVEPSATDYDWSVLFVFNGEEKSHKVKSQSTVQGALDEVNALAKNLGVVFEVIEVARLG